MIDIEGLLERVAHLERRASTQQMFGPVAERDHDKGIRLRLGGTDEAPLLSPWIQPGDRTGASRYLPQMGEQVMLASLGGDWRLAVALPYTHSEDKPNPAKNADETVHHARDGQRHSVEKGHVKDQADKKVSRGAGDGGKEGEGSGKSGANLPHELNRQMQGLRADVTHLRNEVAGVFEAASRMREIAEGRIPELRAIKDILDGKPDSLEKATKAALGNLEGYVAKAFQGALAKLTNGFMSNVMGLVRGALGGQLGGLLADIAALAAEGGVEGLIEDQLAAAQALALDAAVGGSHAVLNRNLDAIGAAFAGTPGEAAFALLRGQIGGVLGGALDVAANLGGMLDGQQNLVKGMTKSYRLGGYDGEE